MCNLLDVCLKNVSVLLHANLYESNGHYKKSFLAQNVVSIWVCYTMSLTCICFICVCMDTAQCRFFCSVCWLKFWVSVLVSMYDCCSVLLLLFYMLSVFFFSPCTLWLSHIPWIIIHTYTSLYSHYPEVNCSQQSARILISVLTLSCVILVVFHKMLFSLAQIAWQVKMGPW